MIWLLVCCVVFQLVLYGLAWAVWHLGLWKNNLNIRRREDAEEIARLRKAVGEQTEMVRRWKNRAGHYRQRLEKARTKLGEQV